MSTGPQLVSTLVRSFARTWQIEERGQIQYSVRSSQSEPRIYVYWHEFVLPAVGTYRDFGIHPFASKSFDGELICRTMDLLGFGSCARGSSSRNGALGLLDLKRYLMGGEHVAITVDGPRGPRRVVKEGALKLAQVSGFAIIPFAFSSPSAFRLKSWDRMILPGPWMRGSVTFGNEIRVPRDCASLEKSKEKVQSELDQLCSAIT